MLIKNPPVEVADGVWMLGTNEYPVLLVIDNNEGAIFEGGIGSTGHVVKEQLSDMDIAADLIKQVIITHAHPDHVMGVPVFRDMFPNIKVCASKIAAGTLIVEKAVGFFAKIDGMLTEALIMSGSIEEKHRPGPLKEKQIIVDRILNDGDKVTVGRRSFDVLATPGHTDCSLSFHEPASGLLIISDVTGYYIPDSGYFWPNYFTGYGATLESIRRLAALDAQIVFLSHNALIKGAEDVKAYFDAAIAATEAYHKRIVTELESGKSPEEIAKQLGIEVHEKTPLLNVEFFQKNCELLVKQSAKYSQNN
jgi:glyoxylase-like metal-dependent hydrolase (beta-lactamase superfamily II)